MSTNPPSPTHSQSTPLNPKPLIETGYNLVAPAYLAWSLRLPRPARTTYLTRLLSHLAPNSHILELGCGAGLPSTRTLLAAGHRVTGVDISAAQIALAREHVPEARLVHGDMMGLEFGEGTFDAVVAFGSLFHLEGGEQGILVRRVEGWLRAGGWFLCDLHGGDAGSVVREDWLGDGVRMFSCGLGGKGNREMVRGSGLVVVEDEVVGERIGGQEEMFHWFLARKGVGEVEGL